MKKYRVYGIFTGTKFLGVYEAASVEEAQVRGLNSTENHVSICHQCSSNLELDDYSCHDATVEEDD